MRDQHVSWVAMLLSCVCVCGRADFWLQPTSGQFPVHYVWTVHQASIANADMHATKWCRLKTQSHRTAHWYWLCFTSERQQTQVHNHRLNVRADVHRSVDLTARVTVLLNGSSVGLVGGWWASANAPLHQFLSKLGGSWLGSTLTYYDWSLTMDSFRCNSVTFCSITFIVQRTNGRSCSDLMKHAQGDLAQRKASWKQKNIDEMMK